MTHRRLTLAGWRIEATLKSWIGMQRLRLRRMKFVRKRFFLAAAAQNIKRLVRFLTKAPLILATAIA